MYNNLSKRLILQHYLELSASGMDALFNHYKIAKVLKVWENETTISWFYQHLKMILLEYKES
jgi:hypothetical protein